MRNGLNPDKGGGAFLFDYGVSVLFRNDDESKKGLIDLLRKYATNTLEQFIEEELEYRLGGETGIRIRNDLIEEDEVDEVSELTCLSLTDTTGSGAGPGLPGKIPHHSPIQPA